jgi:aryl-alcohol dehydrogenase-like predicted oxidoreductase
MEKRKLGSQGLEVSAMGFGCMGLTGVYNAPVDEAQGLAVLRRAVELGITFFDSAEMYGPFENEKLLGKGVRDVRDRVVIATKFGFKVGGGPAGVGGFDSRPEHIREVAEASLKRLGVETIDLFYQHRVDPDVPMEDVAGAVGELVKEGKVRFFGLSEADPESIRRAHAVHPVSALQSEYSLWTRDPERAVLAVCRELGIGFVPFSPLGRGFLGGAYAGEQSLGPASDPRRRMPRFQGEALGNNLTLLENLKRLSAEKGRTPAQLALAWVLSRGDDIVPIPGTTKIARLEENVAAADIRLSPADLAAIETAVPASAVIGARYGERSWTTPRAGASS